MPKLIVKKVVNLTPAERQVCAGMTFKGEGDMLGWLMYPYNDSRAVLAKEGDLVVGWAIRQPFGKTGYWTRREYRRQGIGTKMIKRLGKIGPITVYPHDHASYEFFKKFPLEEELMSDYQFVGKTVEDARRVYDEYVFIGRHASIDGKVVTLHALPPRKEKKKKDDRKTNSRESEESTERSEGAERSARKTNGYTRGKYLEGTD